MSKQKNRASLVSAGHGLMFFSVDLSCPFAGVFFLWPAGTGENQPVRMAVF
ncbi:hypothetical protein [Agrobacterium rosae]|uniref:hypothetical protein n=1 Tax=Agrobacterium rosae TaxID=1972867 RepID=UPI003A801556